MALESEYYTPDGFVDLPYYYVFDAAGLVDGTTPPLQVIPVEWDSDFVLRAILGVPNCVAAGAAGGFLLYNYSGSQSASSVMKPLANQFPIVPEKVYPKSGTIKFALQNILRSKFVCAATSDIFTSQIAFQGVKRYRPGSPGAAPGSPALPAPYDPTKYTLRPWTYQSLFNLNYFRWKSANVANLAQSLIVEVQDYDFELHQIEVSNAVTGVRLTSDLFSATFYDSTAKRALSNLPIPASYFNANRREYGGPVFPVPPILFPNWTQIRVDITSNVCNSDASAPYLIAIDFIGINRVPRVGTSPSAPGGHP